MGHDGGGMNRAAEGDQAQMRNEPSWGSLRCVLGPTLKPPGLRRRYRVLGRVGTLTVRYAWTRARHAQTGR